MKDKKYLKEFINYILKYKISFFLICIFCIFISILNIISPIFVGKIIDIIILKDLKIFYQKISILLIIYFLTFIFSFLLYKILSKLCSKVCYSLRNKLFDKVLYSNEKFLQEKNIGSILNHFSIDIENIYTGLLGFFNKSIIGLFSIIFSVIIMFKINLSLSIILIISGPTMYVISRFITKNTSKFFSEKAEALSVLNTYSNEVFSNSKLVRNFNLNSNIKEKFDALNKNTKQIGFKSHFFSSLTNPSTRFVSNVSYIIVGTVRMYFSFK